MYPAKQDAVTPDDISADLISELAMGIEKPSDIFVRFGFSDEQAKKLLTSNYFQNALTEAQQEWKSATNTEDRVRLKSLVALEELLIHLHAVATDPDTSPAVKVEVAKFYRQTAGMDKRQEFGGTGGSGFQITMNFGDSKPEKVVVDQQPDFIPTDGD